jgi:hypothetical protein
MARGKSCPECRSPMYAQDEKHEDKGSWVTYVCRNGACPSAKRGHPTREKVFEGS